MWSRIFRPTNFKKFSLAVGTAAAATYGVAQFKKYYYDSPPQQQHMLVEHQQHSINYAYALEKNENDVETIAPVYRIVITFVMTLI